MKKMSKIKDQVHKLIAVKPELRDNDLRLIAEYYFYHVGREEIKNLSAIDLLSMMAEGKLPHSESITRVRRKLQEEYPDLRGKTYKARKQEEEKVRQQIIKGL